MVRNRSAIGAAALGLVVATVHFAPGYVNERLVAGTWDWLPQLASTGRTVLLYSYLLRGAAFVVGTIAVLTLGYWAGARLELRADARAFALAIGAGGVAGYLAGIGLFALVIASEPLFGEFDWLSAVLLLGRTMGVGVQFAVAGFAGAALAHVAVDGAPPWGRGHGDVAGSTDGPL